MTLKNYQKISNFDQNISQEFGKKILGCTRNKLRVFVFYVIPKLLIFYFFDTEFSNLRKNDRKWNLQTGSQNSKNHFYESVKVGQSWRSRPVRDEDGEIGDKICW